MNHPTNLSPVRFQSLNQIRRLNDIRLSRDGQSLFWVESVDGTGVIFRKNENAPQFPLTNGYNVRGNVGYGGGEFDVGSSKLVFADKSGGLFQMDLENPAYIQPVTPVWGQAAAPALSPDEQWVVYVYQQNDTDGLAICRTNGRIWPTQLVLGADFYMQPVWHPRGEMLAWVEWNHPYMPWDASCVKVGSLGGMQIRLLEEHWVDGLAGSAASQPRFSPDGKWLSYIRQDGDWDSLVLYNLKKRQKRLLLPADGYHLGLPDWVQGMRSYTWSADSRHIFYFRYYHGKTTLWKVNLRSGKSLQIDISPVTWAAQIESAACADKVAFLGISARIPKQVWQLSGQNLSVAVKSDLKDELRNGISDPQEISFISSNQTRVYGIYYPPLNSPDSAGSSPPLIIDIHGGPTGQDSLCFSSEASFFTSRGFAYAQINYRGSSGYGYTYQQALKHSWGIVDVEDTLNFVGELVERGLADPARLVLKGSSAGGFTALNVLIKKPGLFQAAICSYAVGNLLDDAQNTHKFERFYHRFLTGNLDTDYQRFIDRSPVFHIDSISDPVALFHGDSDKVVAPAQSIEIFNQLTAKGVPCSLKIYEGEGHGFRKTETLEDYYQRIEDFLNIHLKLK